MHFNAHFSYVLYYGGVHSPGVCVNYVCNDLSGLNLRFFVLLCFYLVRTIRLELVCGIVKIDLLQFVFPSLFYIKHMYINAY